MTERDQRLRLGAYQTVAKALRARALKRPRRCAECGRRSHRPMEAHHHRGYAKAHWLDIRWLCRECHNKDDHRQMSLGLKKRSTRRAEVHVRFLMPEHKSLWDYLVARASKSRMTPNAMLVLIIAEHKQFKRPPL